MLVLIAIYIHTYAQTCSKNSEDSIRQHSAKVSKRARERATERQTNDDAGERARAQRKRFPLLQKRLVFPINAQASLAAAKSVTRSPCPLCLLYSSLLLEVCHIFQATAVEEQAASCVT